MKWYEDPIYIKQCEKAEEIQKNWKPLIGDYVATKGKVEGRGYNIKYNIFGRFNKWEYSSILFERKGFVSNLHGYGGCQRIGESEKVITIAQGDQDGSGLDVLPKDIIWFPHQDQLQEIMKGIISDTTTAMGLLGAFFSHIDRSIDYYSNFNSMEQLWLAFVMKEKYNKTWNGKEWVKE